MEKLKIEEQKYRLSNSIINIWGYWAIWITLLWVSINHVLYYSGKSLNQDVMLLLLSSWLWWFMSVKPFLKSWKDDELFENYLITKDVDANIRKSKIQKAIQENIMNNLKNKTDEEMSYIIDSNTPAEMEKARQNLLALNIQIDYIDWKIDTIYKLQKRIKHLIRNKK